MCLHGFTDTWRTWELVLPALERRHEVLAPTLAGHAGGPPIEGPVGDRTLADAVERVMDRAGLAVAHLAGSSLGGHVAMQLAARGRALSVVALAPAGGWPVGDPIAQGLVGHFRALHEQAVSAAPHAAAITSTPEGRRSATRLITERSEHIPPELIAHQMLGVAACRSLVGMVEYAADARWTLDAEHVTCPVRIVWGTADRVLPWPRAAERYLGEWLPNADWVLLDGVGHCPQLDVPVETADLILGWTAP